MNPYASIHLLRVAILACWAFVGALSPTLAQEAALADAEAQIREVFLRPASAGLSGAELFFINVLTGETVNHAVDGEGFALLEDGVIYFDRAAAQVMVASADGQVREHEFIRLPADAERIDWVISDDRETIAWTVTTRNREGLLLTSTMLAEVSGADRRTLLQDGPWKDSRVLPVAFSAESGELIMDAHPDGIDQYLPYRRFANLFGLNLTDGSIRRLPGLSGCFCPAGVGNGFFLQAAAEDATLGAQVTIHPLSAGESRRILAVGRRGFTQPGSVLLSPDGALAVYALSRENTLSPSDAPPQSIFLLADVLALQQSIISEPLAGLVFPISWTEGNAGLLFTDAAGAGTWKLNLADGAVVKVADARYLGRIGG